jgi:predicted nuclease of restriction endonuclease-like (RecB) superfamily
MAKNKKTEASLPLPTDIGGPAYEEILSGISALLESARRSAARAVNSLMTATYWEIGRRIVVSEQAGKARAEYGEGLIALLAQDLAARHGRGFSARNLRQMRAFYLGWEIWQTPSAKFEARTKGSTPAVFPGGTGRPSEVAILIPDPGLATLAEAFRLPWSLYVRLAATDDPKAREFYEAEALRGGWSIRQLSRQIDSQFYQRTLLSRNKAAMLAKGQKHRPEDAVSPEDEIKDPFVLEFLDLKDEYSELELEDALIRHMEGFLLELGNDFAFVGRQKRLRVGDEWYRVDLVFFHRRLRCLILCDLKLGKLTPGDLGQMNFYVNYAREHWTHPDENPPVGLILCAAQEANVARYALGGMSNRIIAAQYRTALPSEEALSEELARTRRELETRGTSGNVRGGVPKRTRSPKRKS